MRDKPVTGWDSGASLRDAGIETVFQDRALAVQQTIVRNIFMGRELTGFLGWLKVNKEIEEASRLMREIGFTSKVFTPHSIVGQLSGGERQGVAIARAIYKQAELIILDEPTTALSLTETAKVFHFVRQVRAGGRSILFIGHNIHHVFDIADRFVVLDRGKVALTADRSEVQVGGRAGSTSCGRRRASRRDWPGPHEAGEAGSMSAMSKVRPWNPISKVLSARIADPPGNLLRTNRAITGCVGS